MLGDGTVEGVLRGEVCHSSWKASLLPTFHISWSEWASALDGCDQPPGPRTPCAHIPPRGAVPPGRSLERTTHPSRAPGRCCGGRSRPGWCGWTSPESTAVPPWIHPGSGIGSRAFGRSSQSHCELRNGPCYSDIQLEFQECEVGSWARCGERRNCHLWGRPKEITDVYNWNTNKKRKARCYTGEGNGTPLQYSCLENPMDGGAWKAAVHGGCWGLDTTEQLHFHFSLSCTAEGNGTHSSVLARRIPGTVEPGGLPSIGSHRVRHDWSDLAAGAYTENGQEYVTVSGAKAEQGKREKCCGIEKACLCHEQEDRRFGWEYPRLKPTGKKSWHG